MFTCSENRSALAAMLNHNHKVLRGLHVIAGYDFEKPFSVRRFDCPVTVARILKETGAAGSVNDLCVSLLIHNPRSEWGIYRDFHCVTVDSFGKTEIVIDRVAWSDFRIDYFSSKSAFEEMRKNPNCVIYAIIQEKDFLHEYTPKKYDLCDRFRLVPGKETRWTDGKGFHGISDITVQRMDASGQNVRIERRVGSRAPDKNPVVVSDFIDKSGYLLPWRRDELKRRAVVRRNEKEKAAYLLTDNSGKIEEIAARIEKVKKALAEEVLRAVTYDDICTVSRRLGYYKGLASIVNHFELFQKYTIEKRFASIANSEAKYREIIAELDALEGKEVQ